MGALWKTPTAGSLSSSFPSPKAENSSLVMWVQVCSVRAYWKKGVSIPHLVHIPFFQRRGDSRLKRVNIESSHRDLNDWLQSHDSLPILVYILILIQDGSSSCDMLFWLHTEKQQNEDRLHFLIAELLCA